MENNQHQLESVAQHPRFVGETEKKQKKNSPSRLTAGRGAGLLTLSAIYRRRRPLPGQDVASDGSEPTGHASGHFWQLQNIENCLGHRLGSNRRFDASEIAVDPNNKMAATRVLIFLGFDLILAGGGIVLLFLLDIFWMPLEMSNASIERHLDACQCHCR